LLNKNIFVKYQAHVHTSQDFHEINNKHAIKIKKRHKKSKIRASREC
jgi:hypothetical protein